LPRAFSSPFDLDGPVYQASNAEYRKKKEKDGEEVVDRPVFYGINATIYPLAGKFAKIKILKKVGKNKTTLLKESETLTPKEVLKYQKMVVEFAKSKSKADSIYNARIFANTYGAETFKKLVAAAEVATNKKSEDEDIEKATEFISSYGKFPTMEDIPDIFEYSMGVAIKLTVPYRIGDCNIAKHSLTYKFVADEVVFKESDSNNQASDAFMNQFDEDSEDEDKENNSLTPPEIN
jgi:hypothetical protein